MVSATAAMDFMELMSGEDFVPDVPLANMDEVDDTNSASSSIHAGYLFFECKILYINLTLKITHIFILKLIYL